MERNAALLLEVLSYREPDTYCAYFESCRGEWWVLVFDHVRDVGLLYGKRLGDDHGERAIVVRRTEAGSLAAPVSFETLEESAWLGACGRAVQETCARRRAAELIERSARPYRAADLSEV